MSLQNLISGKELSKIILTKIKDQVTKMVGEKPQLVIVQVGNNPASNKYIQHKLRACEYTGIIGTHLVFPETISQVDLEKQIITLNQEEQVHGIIVQLPLPKQIDEQRINEIISVTKDADGFNPATLGKVVLNTSTIFPATPAGIVKLLEWKNIELAGTNVVIIGRSNIVGKPLANMLINKSATVTVCNTKTKNLQEIAAKANILVSAAGSAKLITPKFVNENMTIIDVGANFVDGKYCGDVDFESVQPLVKYITPVPGGVGPMTIACLLENTLTSFKNQQIATKN
ncbi:bifunctional 5,10-methylenetetrahydrofolate dehydrogenase/5,10-methenyltetrahydrofolate cyclohydrolase [Spiroplasma clarkii]|uniref:Bifunctional protein FolD n=1 Tax=Spiroplasma clarkii TaxID=2139 RepID=A0A2K8KIJ6_9MOLU|nr:bifunctional 5,10-methylenetetrahydrofolate dehydrogenase/5,10-methenyltetrahydrofolate cyclohydrolase [Spiroplasma clarkii]ATX71497.1 methylenetetrahydrofolate dehydrogenase/methylenetetrahydrofolate cyclohydrolase [Spiroplasma clarkii]